MTPIPPFASVIVAVAVVAVLAGPAAADRRSRDEGSDGPTLTAADEAPRLLRRGLDHYREGRYDEAIEAFRQSNALSPSPKVRVNLALALWKGGDAVAAARELERLLADQDVAPLVVERARSLLADIGKELGRIDVDVRGSGPVWLDERRLGAAPLSERVWVTPGPHELRIGTRRQRITAGAGQVTPARLDAVSLRIAPSPGQAAPSADRTAGAERRRSRVWIAPAAVTGLALGTGLGFALAARADERRLAELNRQSASHEYTLAAATADRGRERALIANVSFAVAAVGAVALTWTLLDERREDGVEVGFGANYAYVRGGF